MKLLNGFLICILIVSCSNTMLVENWKNPEIDSYSPSKVLLVGMTPNLKARQQFEEQLKDVYSSKGIESVMSLESLAPSFTAEKKTEEDLKELENRLISEGFDTVLLTKIIGVEHKIDYKENYDGFDSSYKKFSEDYLKYQDAYYNPDYYNQYNIYHAETSMYCLCPEKDMELIWKGYIDIIDPESESIDEIIKQYVNLVIIVLEEQQLIIPNLLDNKEADDL